MKKIDTIKMVREIREKQFKDIKNKSNEEIIKYFKEKSLLLKKDNKEMVGHLT